jgi:hypothetical protein
VGAAGSFASNEEFEQFQVWLKASAPGVARHGGTILDRIVLFSRYRRCGGDRGYQKLDVWQVLGSSSSTRPSHPRTERFFQTGQII